MIGIIQKIKQQTKGIQNLPQREKRKKESNPKTNTNNNKNHPNNNNQTIIINFNQFKGIRRSIHNIHTYISL